MCIIDVPRGFGMDAAQAERKKKKKSFLKNQYLV